MVLDMVLGKVPRISAPVVVDMVQDTELALVPRTVVQSQALPLLQVHMVQLVDMELV